MCLGIEPMVPANNHCFVSQKLLFQEVDYHQHHPPVPGNAYETRRGFGADVDPCPPALLAM